MRPIGLATTNSTIRLSATGGSERARLTTFPGNHWVAIDADGLTFTGSDGVEAHLLLVEREGSGHRPLDEAFVKLHRRDALDLGPLPPG